MIIPNIWKITSTMFSWLYYWISMDSKHLVYNQLQLRIFNILQPWLFSSSFLSDITMVDLCFLIWMFYHSVFSYQNLNQSFHITMFFQHWRMNKSEVSPLNKRTINHPFSRSQWYRENPSPIGPPSKGATYASVCPGSWDPQALPGAASPACHRLETGWTETTWRQWWVSPRKIAI